MRRFLLVLFLLAVPLAMPLPLCAQEPEEEEGEEDRELTEHDVLAFLKHNIPSEANALKAVEKTDYATYKRHIKETMEWLYDYLEHREWSPAVAEARLQIRKLEYRVLHVARQLSRAATDAETAKLETQIKRAIGKAFDAHVKLAELEILQMKKDIQETRLRIDRRKKVRSRIIERRFLELTHDGDEDDLEWDW